MQRTKCFNLGYIGKKVRFGFQFNREHLGDINGKCLGAKVCLEMWFNHWRIYFFIPSIYTLKLVFFKNVSYEYLKRN